MSQDLTGRSFESARRVVKLCQALDRTPGLGPVCKTMMRERLWHATRRFDRPTMGTFGATPAPKEALKRPPQRRSSPYHKRHALDRSHRSPLARPSRALRSVEDGREPLLPLAEGRGVGSCTEGRIATV